MFAIHLFNKYLLNFYSVPGTAVGIEAISVKKIQIKALVLMAHMFCISIALLYNRDFSQTSHALVHSIIMDGYSDSPHIAMRKLRKVTCLNHIAKSQRAGISG